MRAVLTFLFASLVSVPGTALAQDLAPPPPLDANNPGAPPGQPGQPGQLPANPEQQQGATLQAEEKADSGRPLEWVWLNAEGGASYLNMTSFSSSNLGLQKASDGGPMVGFGAGIRIVVFTFGVRARLHALNAFNMWQLNGEVGFHIPIGSVDPYISAHAGYAFVGRLSGDSLGQATSSSSYNPSQSANDVSIHGFNTGLSLGGDYYFNPYLSLGLDMTLDFLFLHRPPTPLPPGVTLQQVQMASAQAAQLYTNSGDSAGFGLVGSLHLGVHF